MATTGKKIVQRQPGSTEPPTESVVKSTSSPAEALKELEENGKIHNNDEGSVSGADLFPPSGAFPPEGVVKSHGEQGKSPLFLRATENSPPSKGQDIKTPGNSAGSNFNHDSNSDPAKDLHHTSFGGGGHKPPPPDDDPFAVSDPEPSEKKSVIASVIIGLIAVLALVLGIWNTRNVTVAERTATEASSSASFANADVAKVKAVVAEVKKDLAATTLVANSANSKADVAIAKADEALVKTAECCAQKANRARVSSQAKVGGATPPSRLASKYRTSTVTSQQGVPQRKTDLRASLPRFLEEGKVYADAGGNTFERHTGGSRECKFYVNGELVKRQFVQHPDRVESKRQCDILSKEFYATLTPTTSEKK